VHAQVSLQGPATSGDHVTRGLGALGLRRRLASCLPTWVVQAIKFSSIGVLNTGLDIGVYFLLTRWFGFAHLRVPAKGISYGSGVVNSFFWNRSWTFRSRVQARTALSLFAGVNVLGLAINAGVMQLCLGNLGLPELVALGLATASTLAWNFTLSKFVVFRKHPQLPQGVP